MYTVYFGNNYLKTMIDTSSYLSFYPESLMIFQINNTSYYRENRSFDIQLNVALNEKAKL